MFAITAITGKVGGVVANTLLAAGCGVRAVVRDAAKGAPWKARGCEVAVADLPMRAGSLGRWREPKARLSSCRPCSILSPTSGM